MLVILTFLIHISLVFGFPYYESISEDEQKKANLIVSYLSSQCPTWYLPSSSGCKCGSTFGPLIKCFGQEQIKLRVSYCMDFDEDSQLALVGNCPYGSKDLRWSAYTEQSKNVSQLNQDLCSWANRTGFLCSRCKDNLGVSVMSYTYVCTKCLGMTKGWILYFILALVPSTIVFLLIVIVRVRINSAKIISMACICQIITFYVDNYPQTVKQFEEKRLYDVILTAVTIAGIWNLDFFRHIIPPFCISEHLTTLNVIAMEYIVAVYPLCLLVLTYLLIELYSKDYRIFKYLWVPFGWCLHQISWKIDIRHSLIDAFASILQLSYSKLIFVSFNLLAYVDRRNAKGELVPPRVCYYDSEIEYLSKHHIPYFALAIVVLSLLVILPMLLILCYPTKAFQQILGLFPGVNWLPLHAFADAFNGCYKNGTDGTRDYRWFGAVYFILRLGFYLPAITSSVDSTVLLAVTPFMAALLLGLLQPYKHDLYNKINMMYWSLLLLSQVLSTYNIYAFRVPFYILFLLAAVPLVHMVGLLVVELLRSCFPTIWGKILAQLATLSTNESRPSSQQINISHSSLEHSDSYRQSEPDSLVNSENCRILQPCATEFHSYGLY